MAQWVPWHEGTHLVTKNPKRCPTYQSVIKRVCEYFKIDPKNPGKF